jgi:hypothetical protein
MINESGTAIDGKVEARCSGKQLDQYRNSSAGAGNEATSIASITLTD